MYQDETLGQHGEQPGYTAPSAQDLAELSELREYRQRAEEQFNRLAPHRDRIQRLLTDEVAPNLFDDAYKAYQTVQEERRPKLGDEWNTEVNPVLGRVVKMADKIEEWDKRATEAERKEAEAAERAASEANMRAVQEAQTVAEKLIDDYPWLRENNYAGIESIALVSKTRGIPFKEAADIFVPHYREQKQAAAKPPRSLRADAGQPGVPERTKTQADADRPMRDIVLERLRAGRGRAS